MTVVQGAAKTNMYPSQKLRCARVKITNRWIYCLAVAAIASVFASAVRAQSISTGAVTITSMDCGMLGATVCWVYISGPNVGPAGCNTNSIRWDPASSSEWSSGAAACLAGTGSTAHGGVRRANGARAATKDPD
jgi:hypothetical protein